MAKAALLPTDDQDLDPLEQEDQEEQHDEDAPASGDEEAGPAAPADPDPEGQLAEEIEKVGVEEDSPVKKAHMIPRHLIDAELRPEDLWDEGSI